MIYRLMASFACIRRDNNAWVLLSYDYQKAPSLVVDRSLILIQRPAHNIGHVPNLLWNHVYGWSIIHHFIYICPIHVEKIYIIVYIYLLYTWRAYRWMSSAFCLKCENYIFTLFFFLLFRVLLGAFTIFWFFSLFSQLGSLQLALWEFFE